MIITKYKKRLKLTYIYSVLLVLFVGMLVLADAEKYVPDVLVYETVYHVSINGEEVGVVSDMEQAQEWITEVRKNIAAKSTELVFMDFDTTFTSEQITIGRVDEEQLVKDRIAQVLQGCMIETMQRSYTVKVNEYMANLASAEEVETLLETAIRKYDTEAAFGVELKQDTSRELNVLITEVVDNIVEDDSNNQKVFINAGISEQMEQMWAEIQPEPEMSFEDYKLGLSEIGFSEEIEVVEAYLLRNQMTPLEQAVNELTMEQEQQQIYVVQSGDTLSEIVIKTNIPNLFIFFPTPNCTR